VFDQVCADLKVTSAEADSRLRTVVADKSMDGCNLTEGLGFLTPDALTAAPAAHRKATRRRWHQQVRPFAEHVCYL